MTLLTSSNKTPKTLVKKNTLIIAEAGVNHNGDMSMAIQLIREAARAGADFVKFQSFKASEVVTSMAKKADYQLVMTDSVETQYQMLKRLELTYENHLELVKECQVQNISFLSTGFDTESVDLLVKLGQKFLKVPSGEITNLPYLRHIGSYGMPVILSTGMSTLGEVEFAIDCLTDAGTGRDQITALHCSTAYPTPMSDVNLLAMRTIEKSLDVSVGYSDHTVGYEVAIAAVALGATIIEKHFTLSRSLPGPDHQASLEPGELGELVGAVRNIEKALGDGLKKPSQSEFGNRLSIRRSLVAIKPIKAGEKMSAFNVAARRPGNGISPMRWDEVLGRSAKRDFAIDEFIEI